MNLYEFAEPTLWSLSMVEAQESADAEAVAALMGDVEPEAAVEFLSGTLAGVIFLLCVETGISPKEWVASIRRQALGGAA